MTQHTVQILHNWNMKAIRSEIHVKIAIGYVLMSIRHTEEIAFGTGNGLFV